MVFFYQYYTVLLSRLCIQEPGDIDPSIFSEYKGHHKYNPFPDHVLYKLFPKLTKKN